MLKQMMAASCGRFMELGGREGGMRSTARRAPQRMYRCHCFKWITRDGPGLPAWQRASQEGAMQRQQDEGWQWNSGSPIVAVREDYYRDWLGKLDRHSRPKTTRYSYPIFKMRKKNWETWSSWWHMFCLVVKMCQSPLATLLPPKHLLCLFPAVCLMPFWPTSSSHTETPQDSICPPRLL